MIFRNPQWFWLLLIIPIFILYEILIKRRKVDTILYSDISVLKNVSPISHRILYYLRYLFRFLALLLIIFALTIPAIPEQHSLVKTKGVDIILAIDVSTSMSAIDFQPNNRLYVAKEEAKKFISMRTNDRIGLVIFGGKSYTQCPLTVDYNILQTFLEKIETGMVEDGTAIGMGIATAINRLKDSKAKSKVIILLTDGRNNAGEIEPITAAELARSFGIKIYTIGVGKKGYAQIPIHHPIYGTQYIKQKVDIDMETLNKIAQITGTDRAYRAQNTEQLNKILAEIDKLEKTEIESKVYFEYYDLFYYFLYSALLMLILEFLFNHFVLIKLP